MRMLPHTAPPMCTSASGSLADAQVQRVTKAWVTRQKDGLWHIHCTECIRARYRHWCAGKYSNHEAAMSNAAAHMRGEHGRAAQP